jgi:hypothetical protein
MAQLHLVDAWRLEHPDAYEFTGPGLKHRIDYCLFNFNFFTNFLRTVKHHYDLQFHHEDHVPLSFAASSKNQPLHQRKPWRCPVWLLQCADVQEHLFTSLQRLQDSLRQTGNPGCLLDEHKRADSIFLRQMFQEKKNAVQLQHQQLLAQLRLAEAQHARSPCTTSQHQVQQARDKLEVHKVSIQEQYSQNKFDMDVQYAETSSKHFFRSPTPPAVQVAINKVNVDGSTSDDPEVISSTHRRYWGRVFQSPSRDFQDTSTSTSWSSTSLQNILQHSTRRASYYQAKLMEAPLTARDFYEAIIHTAKGKAAGPDGLPAEYYQLFPSMWATIFELVYPSQFQRSRMTKFQRRAYLSLLYKSGDRADPKNYRPLALLNQDAKFGPRILAQRLNSLLPSLLHEDQYGFVPRRSIRHALRRFLDLQALASSNSTTPAGAVLLDFAKAFDSVNWQALDLILRHWGFGANFRHWIKTFYHGTLVQVLINGEPTPFFELGAGVRQGDPLSPALFILFIEPLLNFIRSQGSQLGFQLQNYNQIHHLIAFADDITGLLQDLADTPKFLSLVQTFCSATGMKLNLSKTVIMPFQPWTPAQQDTQLQLQQLGVRILTNSQHTRLLGILVGPICPLKHQFDSLLQRMHYRCKLWKWRARTIKGRALLVKALILPLLWHVASVIFIDDKQLQQIEPLVTNFINDQVSSHVPTQSSRGKLSKLWHPVQSSNGGLNIPDLSKFIASLHCSLLCSAILQVRKSPTKIPLWIQPSLQLFTQVLAGDGVGFDILYTPQPLNPNSSWHGPWRALPGFWLNALHVWNKVLLPQVPVINRQPLQLLFQPLWSNFFLRFGTLNKTLKKTTTYYKLFQDLGVLRLIDFIQLYQSQPQLIQLKSTLAEVCQRPTTSAKALHAKIPVIQLPTTCFRPQYRPEVLGALDHWVFDNTPLYKLDTQRLYQILHDPPAPLLPFNQLQCPEVQDLSSTFWLRQHSLNQHLLPVYADLVYRLQHNSLGCRYKFKWRTENPQPTSCIHGCSTEETPKHLFWDCYLAKFLWNFYLLPFSTLFGSQLQWYQIIYLQDLQLPRQHQSQYGTKELFTIFNLVRSIILRLLWLHRNARLYKQIPTSSYPFLHHQVKAVLLLHTKRYFNHQVNRTSSNVHRVSWRLSNFNSHCKKFYLFNLFFADSTS